MEHSWKTTEIVPLLLLISRERSLSMKLCHLEVSSEEESLNSVLPCWKDLVGTSLTTTLLNLTSLEKVKDVILSVVHAAAAALNSMTTAQEVARDALHMVEEADTAKVTLFLTIADITTLAKTTIAKMMTVTTMLHYLAYKFSVEEQGANVSLVL